MNCFIAHVFKGQVTQVFMGGNFFTELVAINYGCCLKVSVAYPRPLLSQILDPSLHTYNDNNLPN